MQSASGEVVALKKGKQKTEQDDNGAISNKSMNIKGLLPHGKGGINIAIKQI